MTATSTSTLSRDAVDYASPKTRQGSLPPRGMRTAGLVGLLIFSLILTGITSAIVRNRREVLQPTPRASGALAGADTFALGLILGGLRGPLVMFLWTSTENQKIDRDLEDIDTKIELIRRLQPEFDSVHIFQIWNKAYNLSVQMSALPNKYSTILDALRYAHDVDRERPDNVNILVAEAEVYFNKMGNNNSAAEKRYYIDRIRRETLPAPAAVADAQARAGREVGRPTRHESLLDARGLVLPQFLTPRNQAGGTISPDLLRGGYTGAELQFLAHYHEPDPAFEKLYGTPDAVGFPYGVSPIAIGYNYYKRGGLLLKLTNKKHLQMTDAVVDSRGAVALKYWSDEEWERGRRREIELFGRKPPAERMEMEMLTAALPPDAATTVTGEQGKRLAADALFSYRRAAQAAQDCLREYQRHLNDYSLTAAGGNYQSMMDTVRANDALASADRDYFALIASHAGLLDQPLSADQARVHRAQAALHYKEAVDQLYRIVLRYYIDDDIANVSYPTVETRKLDKALIADPKYAPFYAQAFDNSRVLIAFMFEPLQQFDDATRARLEAMGINRDFLIALRLRALQCSDPPPRGFNIDAATRARLGIDDNTWIQLRSAPNQIDDALLARFGVKREYWKFLRDLQDPTTPTPQIREGMKQLGVSDDLALLIRNSGNRPRGDGYSDDVKEYLTYLKRAQERQQQLAR